MGLTILILGLALFLANHMFVGMRSARAAVIGRLGKPVYHTLFGIVSLIAVAVIAWGYAQYQADEWVQVWLPPPYLRHVTVGLMLIACVLLVASIGTSHIGARTRFPLTAAVKVWAFAHLLANGDLGSMIMFGALLVWAIWASIDARRRKDAAVRPTPVGWSGDLAVVIGGVALYLLLGFVFHPYVIGVPVFGS